ncbi:hypothetical protein DPMN_162627 [Dreissena polymorpha]|uniref:Uncharacterized protein n=1 Tax=Dreissena polymorpha TaxID=45954 RepID=A0A9D4ES02_DREPO|nr:hypothetical protein DPMN_162627 [Dreissena polymorpha]
MHGLVLNAKAVSVSLRLLALLCALVVLSGDVEVNPGPRQNAAGAAPKRPATRQRQLSFAQAVASPFPVANSRGRQDRTSDITGYSNILAYLQDMRSEIRQYLASINVKIDDVNTTLNNLKHENEQLKSENKMLWNEISSMKSKMDKLESQSRRNNLRFNGINGTFDEKWSDTEQKVQSFISDELNIPDYANAEIERAHRLKSRDAQQ